MHGPGVGQATQARADLTPPSAAAQHFYRPGLDVLRFVAFFCVFFSHALVFYGISPLSARLALQGGMCLFFVLSSYLITELLLREQRTVGRINVQAFYARRILRIWPLYFVALALAEFTGLIWRQFHIPVRELAAYYLLLGNWYNVLLRPMNSPWQPLWSISLEEQFYLLWPFLVKRGRACVWVLSLLTFPVAAFTVAWYMERLAYPAIALEVWFNSFLQFAYFGLGAILALVLKSAAIQWRPFQQILLWALSALLFCLSGFVFVVARTSYAGILAYSLIAVACLAFFLSLVGDDCSGFKRRFVGLGKISYGLYVFHNPCLFVTAYLLRRIPGAAMHPARFGTANLIAGLALTLIVAELSWNLLEKPFLRLKQRFEFVKTRSL